MSTADPHSVRLTSRQRAVLIELLRGASPPELCQKLGMSLHTGRAHIRAIHQAFGVRSRSQLMALFLADAIEHIESQLNSPATVDRASDDPIGASRPLR